MPLRLKMRPTPFLLRPSRFAMLSVDSPDWYALMISVASLLVTIRD